MAGFTDDEIKRMKDYQMDIGVAVAIIQAKYPKLFEKKKKELKESLETKNG